MMLFEYSLQSFKEFLDDFAAFQGTEVRGDTLLFDEKTGVGYMRAFQLPDGLELLISDFKLNQDLIFERHTSKKETYTLVGEEIIDAKGFTFRIGSDITEFFNTSQSAFYLISSLYNVSYYISQGTVLRGVRVMLTDDWMRRYLHMDKKQDVLVKYIELKTNGLSYRRVDAESKQLIKEILEADKTVNVLFFQTRVLRLIEKFCNWLYSEMPLIPATQKISRHDIDRIMGVERDLVRDFGHPAPTIRELSRKAAMSESKLKNNFKTVFGLPVYEYYQNQRLEKARQMLLSGEYTVSETGHAIGYANLSNFSTAFKKKFNKLPSEIIKD